MFNITNHQRNSNQNHNEISPHTCQVGYHQTHTHTHAKIRSIGENTEKLEPLYVVGGNAKWCLCYGKQYGFFPKN